MSEFIIYVISKIIDISFVLQNKLSLDFDLSSKKPSSSCIFIN